MSNIFPEGEAKTFHVFILIAEVRFSRCDSDLPSCSLRIHKLVPQAKQVHSLCPKMRSDISKASAVDFIVASRVPGEIFTSVVSNTRVMRGSASDPLNLNQGRRCALKKSQLHRVQLSTNVNGVTFWSP